MAEIARLHKHYGILGFPDRLADGFLLL